MFKLKWTLCVGMNLAILAGLSGTGLAAIIELTTNGGFETGDFTGWSQFESTTGNQSVTSINPAPLSTFAGEINNVTLASNSLMKQANMFGMGAVTTSQIVTINFDARGSFATDEVGGSLGGLAFAEFFSELSGGGTSKSEILPGGNPDLSLAVNADPNVWTHFSFTTTTDANDVSGGVTLQLGATTGGASGSTSRMWYDNVSVTVEGTAIPDPNADFDGDADVDGADFLIWQRGFDAVGQVDNSNGDADFNGTVAADDLAIWQTQFGNPPPMFAISAVPEPASILLIGLGVVVLASCRRRVG